MEYQLRTQADLAELSRLDDEIAKLQGARRALFAQCPHLDYKPELIETLSFDLTPRPLCVVCGVPLSHELTEAQKKSLWVAYYKDIDLEFPDNWIEHRDGLNIGY
jgi:hypothetical protein